MCGVLGSILNNTKKKIKKQHKEWKMITFLLPTLPHNYHRYICSKEPFGRDSSIALFSFSIPHLHNSLLVQWGKNGTLASWCLSISLFTKTVNE
jgi:hypothetical protein